MADYWNQSAVSACVHYICDADVPGNVLQLLPEEMRSWADAGWGNNNLISIEICESDYISYTGGANYDVNNEEKFKADILRGYNTAILLCAKICKERGWDPLAKLGNGMYLISSHNEGRLAGLSSAHVDPDHVWGRFNLTMDGFRKAVKAAMNSEGGPYYVRKAWDRADTQIGSYTYLDNAKKVCRSGCHVYDVNGQLIYSPPVFQKGLHYRMQTDLALRTEPKASGAAGSVRHYPHGEETLLQAWWFRRSPDPERHRGQVPGRGAGRQPGRVYEAHPGLGPWHSTRAKTGCRRYKKNPGSSPGQYHNSTLL